MIVEGAETPVFTKFAGALKRVSDRLQSDETSPIDQILDEEFSKVFGKVRAIKAVDRLRLTDIGRDGGLRRSKRKKKSSRANGKKGGRPSPDFKTETFVRRILELLLDEDARAWDSVANYRLPPRYLKYFESLLEKSGIRKSQVGLPAIWSSSIKNVDPIRANAEAARRHEKRYGVYEWPKEGPRPRKYADAVFVRST